MKQNIEIEFKNLLTAAQYQAIYNIYQLNDETAIDQTNYYFDTPDFLLKQHHSALRIRHYLDHYELTLKSPAAVGKLEQTILLQAEQAQLILTDAQLLPEAMHELLANMNINVQDLQCFGSLRTIRYEKQLSTGLLVLDHSFYEGIEDYELEFEVTDGQQGLQDFKAILAQFQIKSQPTPNKIKRLITHIENKQSK